MVSDKSANPNFNTGAYHNFVKLDANHWETCKPSTKDDIAFKEVVQFLKTLIEENKIK